MSSKLYQGIFIPYSGRPEEVELNIESGSIQRKLNCKLTDYVTLWAKDYKLCLFCDDVGVKKDLSVNPLATRLACSLFGNTTYHLPVLGNTLLLDDEKNLTFKDLSTLLNAPTDIPHTEEIANCLIADLFQVKVPYEISFKKEFRTIHIVCREVSGKENMSQLPFPHMCYLGEDMESLLIENTYWNYIVVQVKNIDCIKMTESKRSLDPFRVFIDEKLSVFQDESIINNKKISNILSMLLVSAEEVDYSEHGYKNDITTNLVEKINEIRNKFDKSSLKKLNY
ncbi:18479_t:CDS:1 [Acaulospora morrowiae]|uniref:18479_t:CDS:1 n=1 Tax=Acaulospora morrowiae TaxID=94023 RepID=A0A9N9DIP6_9GLOM|nr:18479_t:CDS:1 [Acaulospora morrowiae]